MGKSIVAILLGLPFSAHCAVIYVEYTGTVDQIQAEGWCTDLAINIGDPVKGLLKVDTDLAPPDSNPTPTAGEYRLGPNIYDSNDFVTGNSPLVGKTALRGYDSVTVLNDSADALGGGDAFFVHDRSLSSPNPVFLDGIEVAIRVETTDRNLIADDGLVQSFVAPPPEARRTIADGFVHRVLGGFRYLVGFTIDRLTVTPGMCHS